MLRQRDILVLGLLSLGVPGVSFAATQTFSANGTFTVPTGITSVSVTAIGGGGGFGGGGFHDAMAYPAYYGARGGAGAQVNQTLTVTPGQTLSVYVGKGGGPGGYAGYGAPGAGYAPGGHSSYSAYQDVAAGGGGGGSSAVLLGTTVKVLAPGGGGGGAPPSFVSGVCYGGTPGAGGGGLTAGGNGVPRTSCGRGCYTGHTAGAGGAGGGGGGGNGSSIGTCSNTSTAGGSASPSAGNGGAAYNAAGGNGSVIFTWTNLGTITVATNLSSASWTITGPATLTGSGTSASYANEPAGTYTITWGAVSGYTAPPTQTFSIVNNGDIINLSGTYTPNTCTNGAINYSACSQCASNYAWNGTSCVTCGNGGCTGTGGSTTNPNGGLVCNNGATNVSTCTTPPTISSFTASPSTVGYGGSTTLSWSTSNATACQLNGGSVASNVTTYSVGPLTGDPSNYVLYCTSAGGAVTRSVSVSVKSPSVFITAVPIRVPNKTGNSTQISWSAQHVSPSSSCAVTKNDAVWKTPATDKNGAVASTTATDSNLTSQTAYSISCPTANGSQTSAASVTVQIVPIFSSF